MQGGDVSSQRATLPLDRVAVSQYAESSSDSGGSDPGSESDSDAAEDGGQRAANAHAAVAGVTEVSFSPDFGFGLSLLDGNIV